MSWCWVNTDTHYSTLTPAEHRLEWAPGEENEAAVRADDPRRQRREQLRWRVHVGGTGAHASPRATPTEPGRAGDVRWLRLHRWLVLATAQTHTHTLAHTHLVLINHCEHGSASTSCSTFAPRTLLLKLEPSNRGAAWSRLSRNSLSLRRRTSAIDPPGHKSRLPTQPLPEGKETLRF